MTVAFLTAWPCLINKVVFCVFFSSKFRTMMPCSTKNYQRRQKSKYTMQCYIKCMWANIYKTVQDSMTSDFILTSLYFNCYYLCSNTIICVYLVSVENAVYLEWKPENVRNSFTSLFVWIYGLTQCFKSNSTISMCQVMGGFYCIYAECCHALKKYIVMHFYTVVTWTLFHFLLMLLLWLIWQL